MSEAGDRREVVHGTAIALAGRAVLLRGPSGAGKSDLALRCIGAPPLVPNGPRAELVADDQVVLVRTPDGLEASPPATIAGRMEVRGVGIVELPYCTRARLALVVDLVAPADVPRYPLEKSAVTMLGVEIPLLRLTPFEASAPHKIVLALTQCPEGLTPP